MKQSTIQKRANEVVKSLPSSGYKMGDKKTLNVTMPDGTVITAIHDTREYYSGRGTKYNSSIRHGNIVETMTIKQLNKAWKPIAEKLKRKAQREKEVKQYLATCNEPVNVEAAARKAVALVGTPGYSRLIGFKTTDGRLITEVNYCYDAKLNIETLEFKRISDPDYKSFPYPTVNQLVESNTISEEKEPVIHNTSLDVYRGCGVYRIGWRNGKITCGVYGGYHNSCPYGVKIELWITAVDKVMAEYADNIVKMDGSGTEFFFRSIEDADLVTNATEIYTVPSAYGGRHLNIQPAEIEIYNSNELSNG